MSCKEWDLFLYLVLICKLCWSSCGYNIVPYLISLNTSSPCLPSTASQAFSMCWQPSLFLWATEGEDDSGVFTLFMRATDGKTSGVKALRWWIMFSTHDFWYLPLFLLIRDLLLTGFSINAFYAYGYLQGSDFYADAVAGCLFHPSSTVLLPFTYFSLRFI